MTFSNTCDITPLLKRNLTFFLGCFYYTMEGTYLTNVTKHSNVISPNESNIKQITKMFGKSCLRWKITYPQESTHTWWPARMMITFCRSHTRKTKTKFHFSNKRDVFLSNVVNFNGILNQILHFWWNFSNFSENSTLGLRA